MELGKVPKIIIDAGANIGFASIYFSLKYPEAKIYAIEPDEENFNMLKRNTENYQNVVAIKAALWNENTSVDLFDRNTGSWGFAVTKAGNVTPNRVSEVDGITVPKIMETYKINFIDILKIDIEGAEKEVFQDSGDWIDKVGVIAVELHDRIKMGCQQAFDNAAKDFEYKYKDRENTFVIRAQYMNNKALLQTPVTSHR
jgi:FkbM family methyltransferase